MIGFAREPFEDALTVELSVLRYAPEAEFAGAELVAFADTRALPGLVVTADDRCFTTEAREELADCCSYLAWKHHQLREDAATDDELAAVERAIAAIAVAWLAIAALSPKPSLAAVASTPSRLDGGPDERSAQQRPTHAAANGHPRAALRDGAREDRPSHPRELLIVLPQSTPPCHGYEKGCLCPGCMKREAHDRLAR